MKFQNKLLRWFKKNQRPLPWRRHYRPYEVWISEIMLQQTQVETALPFYRRWMGLFPDVKSLAASSEEKVLKTWQGLGYYSRARNLHAAAKKIAADFDGQFPSRFEDIRSLKGVGPYTAGAIASIAFNEDRPIVDGNVLRVLSRLYAIRKPIDVVKNREYFWSLQESLIPKNHARNFNQALMEFGALVCLPKNPKCGDCPLEKFCAAKKTGQVERFPFRAQKRRSVKVEAASLVVTNGKNVLIHKRPVGKIMGGLWEFPEWKLSTTKSFDENGAAKKVHELGAGLFGSALETPKPLGKIKRSYTHHRETLWVFGSRLKKAASFKGTPWPHAWVPPSDFGQYPFSSAHAKIASLVSSIK